MLCKNLNPLDSFVTLNEWFTKCPPQKGLKHWKDGRSAKETAKHWVKGIPVSFSNILAPFNLFFQLCSPEYVTKVDNLNGNSRNHDLLIVANNNIEQKIIISVESKVDEPFDKSVSDYLKVINQKKVKNIPTKADIRLNGLLNALFLHPNLVSKNDMKYQLMIAVAGTLAECKKQHSSTAVFLVQTFVSQNMDSVKHRTNQRDLDYFIEYVSNGEYKIIHDGDLLGPIRVPGNQFIPNDVDLWIGKYSIHI